MHNHYSNGTVEHLPSPSRRETHRCCQASDLTVVLGVNICQDCVLSLLWMDESAYEKSGDGGKLTGGISLGRSTLFVMVASPSSIGHVMFTFLTWSQRSAVVFIITMRPYLTCSLTYAPFSIFSSNVPTAEISNVLPLDASSASGR
jgi:hypothetical protein